MINYRVHLIRHGITQGNLDGRYIGRTDLCLCRQGIQELEVLQTRYEFPAAEMVVSSPLQRCIQTADILYPNVYAEQWEDFIECNFGDYEGKTPEDLKENFDFSNWISSGMATQPPHGESSSQLVQRVAGGMQRLFERMMREKIQSVALVTHGGVITALLYGMGLPKRDVTQCMVGNGRGYTLLMTPQLWMREHAFEIYGVVPYGLPESEIRKGMGMEKWDAMIPPK